MLAGRLDGRAPDVQGATQPMHKESQRSRSQTQNPYKDKQGRPWQRESRPNSLRPNGRTIWERTLVGYQRSRQAR